MSSPGASPREEDQKATEANKPGRRGWFRLTADEMEARNQNRMMAIVTGMMIVIFK